MFLFFSLQKGVSCWKIFPSLPFFGIQLSFEVLALALLWKHENTTKMASVPGIFAIWNQMMEKNVPSSIHDHKFLQCFWPSKLNF